MADGTMTSVHRRRSLVLKCPGDLEEAAVDVTHALLGIDEHREDREERDGRDPGRVALVLERDRDERDERHRRHAVQRAHERVERVVDDAPAARRDAEEDPEHQRDGGAAAQLAEALAERVLQLAEALRLLAEHADDRATSQRAARLFGDRVAPGRGRGGADAVPAAGERA